MKLFRYKDSCLRAGAFAALAVLMAPAMVHAQYFDYTSGGSGQGALLAGFRKASGGTKEVVAKVGNITDFLAMPEGATMNLSDFSSQLTGAFTDYGNLRWSVTATFVGAPYSTWNGYKLNTVWFTVPRADAAVPAVAPARHGSGQSVAVTAIDSIGKGGNTISMQIGTTDENNNTNLVVEPLPNSSSLGNFIADPQDNTYGDLGGGVPVNVENTTPASFTTAARSDLYQSVPTGYTDPNTDTTSGDAYYVGYFTFNTDGTMTFTRASSVVLPPAPQITQITRSGTTSTVFFTTASGSYTYSLHYTNSAGLTAPVADWPVSPTTVMGDGTTKQLTDTSADATRFYRVSAQ